MKKELILIAFLISITTIGKAQIAQCYLTFNHVGDFEQTKTDRLPENNPKIRTLITATGDVNLTIKDGYRILYANRNQPLFVDLKVELFDSISYTSSQKKLLDNLSYINAESEDMETSKLMELTFSGYKIYGLNRAGIEQGQTMGTFVMFPGNNTVVYFYFKNAEPDNRSFKTIDEYKAQRNDFFLAYAAHLKKCL